jgi:hypothetical protein
MLKATYTHRALEWGVSLTVSRCQNVDFSKVLVVAAFDRTVPNHKSYPPFVIFLTL